MPDQSILDTLYDELDLYSELLDTLQQQQQLLAAKDSKKLHDCANQIVSLVTAARESRQKRSQALQTLDIKNNQEGMDYYLETLRGQQASETMDTWDELMDLVEECKAINQVNGRMLNLQQQMTDRMLQRLELQAEHPAYSSDGQLKKERLALFKTSI